MEDVMYARITTYHCKTEKLSEAVALLEKLKPEAMAIPGLKNFLAPVTRMEIVR